ncbi:MAG: serine--tRNA ligase [Bacteroidales bacterium]|nr:serine--tRNA ligase [Bacteroidales bacterium]MCB8998636.1 serine--tRNA ligase [Bacteroidales bacterium]MCB9012496.1 serine--tRNA ligase [Bacteroidales bacterium]
MLTINTIRENRDFVIERLKIKNFKDLSVIDTIIELDNNRRTAQKSADDAQAEMNILSKEIGRLFQTGKTAEANQAKDRTSVLKENIKEYNQKYEEVSTKLNQLLVQVPNLPHASVPVGKTPEDNVLVRGNDIKVNLPEGALPHWDLGTKYDFLDFDLGTKLTGAGFPVFKGKGAKLQRALINFFLDENEKAGYREILPPLMVNEDSGFGTGQLPDKEGQMYHCQIDNFYLIPTAEVPVTNIYRDVILDASELPCKNTAYTPCFRREAGSYGKDVRGLNRVHQFDKVEIVQIAHPDHSYAALEEMVNHVEGIVKKLELPYRIIKLCGGDMSFTSALTYDFEVYAAAQGRWLEVSSVSNFESYQANRLKLRFKEKGDKKTTLAHTLNGSSLALPRIVAALLENNQTPEGIRVPEILQSFTGFSMIN